MYFTSEQQLSDGVAERDFKLGEISGSLWTPPSASPSTPVPLILMGQPGGIGMRGMYPRLAARARSAAGQGFASVSIEMPGVGDRAPLPGVDEARVHLRQAISAGEKPDEAVIDQLILPLVEKAVPEADHARRGSRPPGLASGSDSLAG